MTGFLEESEGVRSMTRLTIAVLLALTTAVVAVLCWYVLRNPKPSATILGALTTLVTALVLNGTVAIINRHVPSNDNS